MKIAFDAKRLFNNHTGLGNYSRSLVRNLQSYFPEHAYHLFTPDVSSNEQTAYFNNKEKFHVHESKARLKAYWRSFSMVKDLINTNIDIYHGLSNELPHNISQSGIKSVVTIHDLIFKIYPETYSIAERVIYDRKFRYACQHADKIVAISEHTKKDIIRYYQIPEEKIAVIYQTCNPIFYHQRSDEENAKVLTQYHLPKEFLLSVGSVESRKNLKLIIETYKQYSKQINIPLVIIGKGGQYKKDCINLIAKYGLGAHFIWLDKLSDNLHLQSIYQSATALIYPSFYEGFGLPIAEALLCKTPVIAGDTSSLREAGGANTLYIQPNNVEALAQSILQIKDNKDLALHMGEAGYQYALNTFSAEQVSTQMLRLYEGLK